MKWKKNNGHAWGSWDIRNKQDSIGCGMGYQVCDSTTWWTCCPRRQGTGNRLVGPEFIYIILAPLLPVSTVFLGCLTAGRAPHLYCNLRKIDKVASTQDPLLVLSLIHHRIFHVFAALLNSSVIDRKSRTESHTVHPVPTGPPLSHRF